jgi:hypothetical protein
LSVILLLSMPLQGCGHQRVIGPSSPPQDYSEANDLLAGRRVRVEMTTGRSISGAQFVTVAPDSIRFVQGEARAPISIPAERFLYAIDHNRWKGLALGTAIVGGVSAIMGLFITGDLSGDVSYTAGQRATILGIIGGVFGGLGGLIQGAPVTVRRDWTR